LAKLRPHRTETGHAHLVTRVAIAASHDTAGEVIARIREHPPQFGDVIYVVDRQGCVEGAAGLVAVLAAPAGTRLGSLAHPAHPMFADVDQEHVATHALRHGLVAVPMVDDARRLLGVVPPGALMQILRREHVEDIHRLAGIGPERVQAREAMEAPPLRRARDRLPWLLIGLLGSMVATFVMASFEARLEAKLAIAFFVPAIVYLADAIGTQTEAIAVRGLSLSHTPIRELVWGEARTGIAIGAVLGGIAWPGVWLVFDDARLATTVALSLVTAGAVATTIGLLFPWLLARAGRDPAYGSGPLATIIQDTLSLIIYFAMASLLLF
jgi:magnesium transporter